MGVRRWSLPEREATPRQSGILFWNYRPSLPCLSSGDPRIIVVGRIVSNQQWTGDSKQASRYTPSNPCSCVRSSVTPPPGRRARKTPSRMTTELIQLTNDAEPAGNVRAIAAHPIASSGTGDSRPVAPRPTPQNTDITPRR
jgi:hypothetical protein